MGDANFRVHLGKLPLSSDWQAYLAPINSYSIELTADVDWAWCTDRESDTWRGVAAYQRETIISTIDKMILKGQPIVWVKGTTDGTLFEKCVR